MESCWPYSVGARSRSFSNSTKSARKGEVMIFGGIGEFFLVKGLLAAFGAGAVATAITWTVKKLLRLSDIQSWFTSKEALLQDDADHLAVLLKKEAENGKIPIVQGIFSKKTKKFVAAQGYQVEELESDLEKQFGGKQTIISRAA